jgi:hypothetical protein
VVEGESEGTPGFEDAMCLSPSLGKKALVEGVGFARIGLASAVGNGLERLRCIFG